MENDEVESRTLWGKKLSEIPCFRNSYLYGISGGIAAGIIYFMFTSKVKMSSHVAFSVFAATTLTYWTYCRYKWETNETTVALMKEFLKDRISKEGTELENMPAYDVSNRQNLPP